MARADGSHAPAQMVQAVGCRSTRDLTEKQDLDGRRVASSCRCGPRLELRGGDGVEHLELRRPPGRPDRGQHAEHPGDGEERQQPTHRHRGLEADQAAQLRTPHPHGAQQSDLTGRSITDNAGVLTP